MILNVLCQVTLASVVTLTFDLRSWNVDYTRSGYELNIFTENEVNPFKDIGGVREQTNTHTDGLPVL